MLVDDHQIVRDGIKSHLERTNKYKIVAEAINGLDALDLIKESTPDLIIMDIHMKQMDGITCTKEISRNHPHIKVLALTMHNESQYIKQMLAAGAAGYLLKNCDQEELTLAIDQITKEGSYFSPQVTKAIMNTLTGTPEKAKKTIEIPLTDRELEILHLILKEFSNKEISEKLFIGIRTVDAHKRNLLEKTGSKNVAGLVLYAVKHELFNDL